MEAILHLVPEGRRAQGTLHGHIEYGAVFLPGDAERIDNVLVNRHREGVRLLEDHPDAAAKGDNLDRRVVDACPVDGDIPLVADTRDELVHPVEIPQQGRFTASRRADESGHLPRGNGEIDPMQGLFLSVEELKVPHLDEISFARRKIIGELQRMMGKFGRLAHGWFFGGHDGHFHRLAVLGAEEKLGTDIGDRY